MRTTEGIYASVLNDAVIDQFSTCSKISFVPTLLHPSSMISSTTSSDKYFSPLLIFAPTSLNLSSFHSTTSWSISSTSSPTITDLNDDVKIRIQAFRNPVGCQLMCLRYPHPITSTRQGRTIVSLVSRLLSNAMQLDVPIFHCAQLLSTVPP